MAEQVKVTIYSKPDCHLCVEAKEVMRGVGCNDLYTLEEINIESDPELFARYRYDIPVILIDGTEAFRHRLIAEEFNVQILRRQREKTALPNQELTAV
ncbi:MAG TPA: glutaredoxin family protein [Pyrinomonadaceae bacterium]|nr:glutaredoxin family protein [Pyrinomonadaceae bacterium]